MTDKVETTTTTTTTQPESNQGSQPLSLQDIMAGTQPAQQTEEPKTVEVAAAASATEGAGPIDDKTKADGEVTTVETKTEDPIEAAKAKLQQRVDDTQKWGQTQRSAVLTMIKNLKESGVEEAEIKKLCGGDEVYDKVLQNIPIETHLQNDDTLMETAFNNTVSAAEAVLLEQGETVENLKKYVQAFNAIGLATPEHKAELLRRAQAGGNAAAYVFKHGKDLLADFEFEQKVRTKGLKNFIDEQKAEIRKTLEEELTAKRDEQNATQTNTTPKKPNLVGGTPSVETSTNNDTMSGSKSIKDIMGR